MAAAYNPGGETADREEILMPSLHRENQGRSRSPVD